MKSAALQRLTGMTGALPVSYTHLDVYKRQVASWAREAVAVCYISGIMVGDNGSFKPTDLLSRAQLAQVFRSFYDCLLYTSRCV